MIGDIDMICVDCGGVQIASNSDEAPTWFVKWGDGWRCEKCHSEKMDSDGTFLLWIYYRLINVHNESPFFDYMHRFKSIIDRANTAKDAC